MHAFLESVSLVVPDRLKRKFPTGDMTQCEPSPLHDVMFVGILGEVPVSSVHDYGHDS